MANFSVEKSREQQMGHVTDHAVSLAPPAPLHKAKWPAAPDKSQVWQGLCYIIVVAMLPFFYRNFALTVFLGLGNLRKTASRIRYSTLRIRNSAWEVAQVGLGQRFKH